MVVDGEVVASNLNEYEVVDLISGFDPIWPL